MKKITTNINFLKLGVLLFGVLLLWNCEKEEDFSPKQKSALENIQSKFNSKDFEKTIPCDFSVNWSNATKLYSDELKSYYYEFPLSYNSDLNPFILKKKAGNYYTTYKILVTEGADKNITFYTLKSYEKIAETGNFASKVYFNDTKTFTGIIHLLDKDRNIVFAKKLEKGEKAKRNFYDKELKQAEPIKRKYIQRCIIVETKHYIDYYYIREDDNGNKYLDYNSTRHIKTTRETICNYEWLPDLPFDNQYSGGNNGGAGAGTYKGNCSNADGSYQNIDTNPCVVEVTDKIIKVNKIINELTGKALCVYNKLKELSGGFKDAIQEFDGEFPVSHLRFISSSSLPNNVNAKTSPPSNFLITIQVNENKLSRPNLSIARTLIHETIHAEMFRKILSILDNGGNLEGLTRSEWNQKLSNGDYPGIFDYYSRFGVDGMQHEQIAAHYRTTINGFLKEFQPGLSQNIYESLAWSGLKDTTSWNSLSSTKKREIDNIITNFNSTGSENCN